MATLEETKKAIDDLDNLGRDLFRRRLSRDDCYSFIKKYGQTITESLNNLERQKEKEKE